MLFTDTDSLMYEMKSSDFRKKKKKEMLDFSNNWANSKYDSSNKWIVGKRKDDTGGVATEEFFG